MGCTSIRLPSCLGMSLESEYGLKRGRLVDRVYVVVLQTFNSHKAVGVYLIYNNTSE